MQRRNSLQLAFAVSALLFVGHVAMADSFEMASQVLGLKTAKLSNLPEATPQSPNNIGGWACALEAKDIKTSAGKAVAARNWQVISETEQAGFTFVSFAAKAEAGTSGSCLFSEGNVGIFREANLLGLVYATDSEKLRLGHIVTTDSNTLRILSGDYISMPIADVQIIGGNLLLVKNVAARMSFCEGTSSVPNTYGLPIHIARRIFLAEGWRPAPPDLEKSQSWVADMRKTLPEVEDCSGTGFGFCKFNYHRDDGQNLSVTTAGEGSPTIIGFSARCAP